MSLVISQCTQGRTRNDICCNFYAKRLQWIDSLRLAQSFVTVLVQASCFTSRHPREERYVVRVSTAHSPRGYDIVSAKAVGLQLVRESVIPAGNETVFVVAFPQKITARVPLSVFEQRIRPPGREVQANWGAPSDWTTSLLLERPGKNSACSQFVAMKLLCFVVGEKR